MTTDNQSESKKGLASGAGIGLAIGAGLGLMFGMLIPGMGIGLGIALWAVFVVAHQPTRLYLCLRSWDFFTEAWRRSLVQTRLLRRSHLEPFRARLNLC